MHPILFKFGSITFYSYGLMIGLGYIAGVFVASRRMEKKGLNPDSLFSLFLLLLFCGVLGGRIMHVALNTWYYTTWQSFFDPQSGLSLHGVLLGGLLTMILYSKAKKVSFLLLADILAPSVILGQSIGRIGCFLNGCCYGIPTGKDWGVLTRYAPGLRHPYQLYESFFDFVLFLALLWASSRIKVQGGLFLMYLSGYSTLRFFLEFFRDNDSYLLGLSYGQWTSLGILIVSSLIYVYLARKEASKRATQADSGQAKV